MDRPARKSLYFCRDCIPTAEERAEAQQHGITAFRNAQMLDMRDYFEQADLVAGRVPNRYYTASGVKVIPPKDKPKAPFKPKGEVK